MQTNLPDKELLGFPRSTKVMTGILLRNGIWRMASISGCRDSMFFYESRGANCQLFGNQDQTRDHVSSKPHFMCMPFQFAFLIVLLMSFRVQYLVLWHLGILGSSGNGQQQSPHLHSLKSRWRYVFPSKFWSIIPITIIKFLPVDYFLSVFHLRLPQLINDTHFGFISN